MFIWFSNVFQGKFNLFWRTFNPLYPLPELPFWICPSFLSLVCTLLMRE